MYSNTNTQGDDTVDQNMNDELDVLDDANDVLHATASVLSSAKRRMTLQQLEDHSRRVSVHQEQQQQKKEEELHAHALKSEDSFHYLNEVVKNTVDQGINQLSRSEIKLQVLVALRPVEQNTTGIISKNTTDLDLIKNVVNLDDLDDQADQDLDQKRSTLAKIQKIMHQVDFGSFAAPHSDFKATEKHAKQWLQQQLRNTNAKLHRSFRYGEMKKVDRLTRKLTELNRDLLILRGQTEVAELGAVCALMKNQSVTGTSKRQWTQVHKAGARWLEKTRELRSYRKKKDRENALLKGDFVARRTLSPLLQTKVCRMRLQSEEEMKQFSLTHHRLNRPGGRCRKINFHLPDSSSTAAV